MFDLVDILKKDSAVSEGEQSQGSTTVLFFQTEECRQLVLEAYRFEGMQIPAILPNKEDEIKSHVRDKATEIVIIELNSSNNVVVDAEKINHLLPNDASVIVVGSEDAISTIRNLKQMGFYYLFWPITKHELTEFVKGVEENRNRNKGLGKKRMAKQISFIGCKGGVGTSFLASEVAHLLSEDKRSSCVLVDNDYQGGNLDIILGLEKFEKRQIRSGSFISNLDATTAQSLLTKKSNLLSLLALTSQDHPNIELYGYTKTVSEFLAENVNFILDDISSCSRQTITTEMITERSDCIVLIFNPTIAAVREAARVKKRIQEAATSDQLRLILVLNRNMPDASATVNTDEIAKFLRQPVDVEIPYIKKLDSLLLDDKRLSSHRGKPAKMITKLVLLIVGEDEKKKTLFAKVRRK